MRCILLLFITLLLPLSAYAQCSNPHAEMGVLIMNKKHKVMQYCNGDVWVGLWGGGGGGGLPSCSDGEIAQFSGGEWQCNDGSALDNLNAANLKSGTVPSARLGSGTANNTTYLRGDGQWAAPSGGGITAVTTASCSGNYNTQCIVNCPAGYYRTGCSASTPRVEHQIAWPQGAGCRCDYYATCFAYCAK